MSKNESVRLFTQAIGHQHAGNDDLALDLCQKIISNDPVFWDAHMLQGVIWARRNEFERAANHFALIVQGAPQHTGARYNWGLMLSQAAKADQAAEVFQDLLALEPNNVHGLNGLAVLRASAGRQAEAMTLFERSLRVHPQQPDALNNLGNCAVELGDLEAARDYYQNALNLSPDYADAWFNLAKLQVRLNLLDQARQCYQKVLSMHPGMAPARINLAKIDLDQGRYAQALACLDQGVAYSELEPALWFSIGVAQEGLNEPLKAIDALSRAIELKPDYFEARVNRANLYGNIGQLSKAMADLRHAERAEDTQTQAAVSAAYALIYPLMDREHEVEAAFKRAIKLNPVDLKHQVNFGFWLLKQQRFSEAWPLYVLRHQVPGAPHPRWLDGVPIWSGGPVQGRVLIIADQGIGDEVFHTKCLRAWLLRWGPPAGVTLDPRVLPLLEPTFPNVKFWSRYDMNDLEARDFDVQVALGDIGAILSIDPLLHSIVARPHLGLRSAGRLEASLRRGSRPRVGLSWRSTNAAVGTAKSMSLHQLIQGLMGVDAEWVNLQYGLVDDEIERVRADLGVDVFQAPSLDVGQDLAYLAGLIESCDAVVTTSNSTAHLCGGLGKPGYVLVPFAKGKFWYWHTQDGPSVWYPSLQVLHGQEEGTWSDVLELAATQLSDLFALGWGKDR